MLEQIDIDNNYNEFLGLLKKVNRDGLDKLLNYLEHKNFKELPATSKYFGNYKGGLVEHCLQVYKRLCKIISVVYPGKTIELEDGRNVFQDNKPFDDESIIIVALLHDISKVGYYIEDTKSVKDVDGNWVKQKYYRVAEPEEGRIVYGSNAQNSLFMVGTFIKLKTDEQLAILHQSGGIDSQSSLTNYGITAEVWKKSPLALLLHQADVQAAFLGDKVE